MACPSGLGFKAPVIAFAGIDWRPDGHGGACAAHPDGPVGLVVGMALGATLGLVDGTADGACDGASVGALDGASVGAYLIPTHWGPFGSPALIP